jgi:hypothetical protein
LHTTNLLSAKFILLLRDKHTHTVAEGIALCDRAVGITHEFVTESEDVVDLAERDVEEATRFTLTPFWSFLLAVNAANGEDVLLPCHAFAEDVFVEFLFLTNVVRDRFVRPDVAVPARSSCDAVFENGIFV